MPAASDGRIRRPGGECPGVVLTALILAVASVAISALGARAAFTRLGLDLRELLLWFGLAELPAPPTSRRNTRVR